VSTQYKTFGDGSWQCLKDEFSKNVPKSMTMVLSFNPELNKNNDLVNT